MPNKYRASSLIIDKCFIMKVSKLFIDAIHPGNEFLLHEKSCDDGDIQFLYEYEKGSIWSEIDSHELGVHWECIFFLSKEGLYYVTPKFLEMLNSCHGWCDEWIEAFQKIVKKKKTLYSVDQIQMIDSVIKCYKANC